MHVDFGYGVGVDSACVPCADLHWFWRVCHTLSLCTELNRSCRFSMRALCRFALILTSVPYTLSLYRVEPSLQIQHAFLVQICIDFDECAIHFVFVQSCTFPAERALVCLCRYVYLSHYINHWSCLLNTNNEEHSSLTTSHIIFLFEDGKQFQRFGAGSFSRDIIFLHN